VADEIQIKSNARAILAKFHRLPNEVQAGVKRGLARGLLLAEENVRRGADLRFSGARSGLLSRLTSHVEVLGGGMDVDGVIGFRKTRGFPYELSQEFGAKAKPGKAMAVPVSDEAKRLSAQGKGPREMDVILFVPPNTHVLAEQMGTQLQVHYVLMKSLKPRLNFRKSVRESMAEIGEQVVKEAEAAT